MTKDITERLRAVLHNDRSVELMNREAADEIERLRKMLEVQDEMVKHYVHERDTIRRTYCFIIASGNFNARDGNTAFKGEAEYVAELNRWDCFRDNP